LNDSKKAGINPGSSCILITGAGSGFGAAMARHFAAAGYRVAVTDISEQRAQSVLKELQNEGGDGFASKLDVCLDTDWEAVYTQVEQEWGGLDVLVNNAGVAAAGLLEESTLEDWQWVLDINLMGVVRGCHRFLPMMRRQNRGWIVNVASFAGLASMPGLSAYGTAKAAVVSLSEHLRAELDGSDVGVSVVCPAFVKTRLMQTFRAPEASLKTRVEGWMDRSGVTAEMVAAAVYDAVRTQHFMVLTHAPTRWAWRFKRWFPERYYRTILKQRNLHGGEGI
jgi:NADP-dependent 3-hydroxy acid dehydrogenase YdfG